MARWLAALAALAAVVALALGAGCRSVEPKSAREVRKEGAQRAPQWDTSPAGTAPSALSATTDVERVEDQSAESGTAEAEAKAIERQRGEEWIQQEFKVGDEDGDSEDKEDADDEE